MKKEILDTLNDVSDDDLLEYRLCDFNIPFSQCMLYSKVQFLHDELNHNGLVFRPDIYLGDEWFSPDGVPAIAIPFYLIHPRLVSLEKKMIGFAEGEEESEFKKLLRHECGHAVIHGFNLTRNQQWRKYFGDPRRPFNDHYRFKAYSRHFVHHIPGWYAQSHPEEDFCETFSVWLDPESTWREKYKGWPVLGKLNYVENLMMSLKGKSFLKKGGVKSYHVRTLKRTLRTHYKRRRKELAQDTADYFDDELEQLFSREPSREKADVLLRRFRANMESILPKWSGARKYEVRRFIKKISERCNTLGLYAPGPLETDLIRLVSYIACRITHHHVTNQYRPRGGKSLK